MDRKISVKRNGVIFNLQIKELFPGDIIVKENGISVIWEIITIFETQGIKYSLGNLGDLYVIF